ncbi:hypothetical protein [Neisseria animalis]|uniref:Uncharacterized protein n=1 Tax=Neisseria animalis TaxID=492 RepID=A0A5P3MS75_NEIAN|nr:hypothetical protein [Neisseria animalis]QEY24466.1 hypothetical protein D0T90_08290 [Neisseria animalis]ROW33114.1 hypothetical protein CGZ60_02415 [Neisseria animalis]VEE07130.1 Uncharacterised protein [Neisseria animalis]
MQIMQKVSAYFKKFAKNKPSSRSALRNSFQSVLKLSDKKIEKLINRLVHEKKISISNTGKISYLKI